METKELIQRYQTLIKKTGDYKNYNLKSNQKLSDSIDYNNDIIMIKKLSEEIYKRTRVEIVKVQPKINTQQVTLENSIDTIEDSSEEIKMEEKVQKPKKEKVFPKPGTKKEQVWNLLKSGVVDTKTLVEKTGVKTTTIASWKNVFNKKAKE